MADNANIMDIQVDTRQLQQQTKDAAAALTELDAALSGLNKSVRDAFTVKGYKDYLQTVERFGKSLANELLVLQLRFGQLKVAVAQALAPVASVFVPMLNDAMLALIRFSGVVGQFLQGLLGTTQGSQNMSKAVDVATKSQNKLTKATKRTGKALRRTLAGFDQLERLNHTAAGSAGGAATPAATVPVELTPYVPQEVSEQVQGVIDKILQFFAPLREIDLTNLRAALQNLGQSFQNLGALAGTALKYLWEQVLTPFIGWVLEKLAPALTEGFAAKLDAITAAMTPVMAGLQQLWQALQPVVAYIGQSVLQALGNWKSTYIALAQVLSEKSGVITGIFQNISQMASAMWNMVSPILTAMRTAFQNAFDGVLTHVKATVGYLLEALSGLTGYLAGVFTGNWKSAWTGIKTFLKNTINGIIGLMNTMIARLVATLNAVISAANKISFTLPSWIPELGGKTFGLNLKTVTAPKIPYLAQGAVLPANKPFLAMVGDQRHGTNIEAPLTTIQEAVAGVLGDQTGAIVRGFEVSIQVQKEILEAVLGITIGDEVVGRAAERYRRRMAIMGGGY